MEGNVDSLEGDGGETALKVDGLGFGFGFLGALLDNFYQVGFYLLKGDGLHQRLDVNFLSFQVVGDVCEAVQSA